MKEDLLKLLKVVQEKRVYHRLGKQVLERLNPYNPLSYVLFISDAFLGTLLYGLIGYWRNFRNPFKYR